MPIVAYVTRTYADSGSFSQSVHNVGNAGGVAYSLRKADGQNLGSYQSVPDAQRAFRQFYGTSNILHWKRQDMAGQVEQHVAVGLPLDPSEIWGDDLTMWVEPFLGVSLLNSATKTIFQMSDLSGNGYPCDGPAGEEPVLISEDGNFNDRPTVDFDEVATQRFDVTGLTVTVPFTMIFVANSLAVPGTRRTLIYVAGTPVIFGTNLAGNWELNNGGGLITSSLATSTPRVITIRQSAVAVELRIDGVVIGTNAAAPANGALTISRSDGTAWGGRFAMFNLISVVDADDMRVRQAERYAMERFK